MPLNTFGKTTITVGLLSSLTCLGSTITMSINSLSEDQYDRAVTTQLVSISESISQKSSTSKSVTGQQDVVPILKGLNVASGGTSVFASGTIESGYCLVGIDTRGELAETGIFYDSKNPNAKTLTEQTSCASDVSQMPLVIGEGPDGSELLPDDTDKALTMTFGALGVSLAGLVSCMFPVALRPAEDDEEETSVLPTPAKIDPPKQEALAIASAKPLPAISSPSKSGPAFTKEGVTHKLTQDVSLRSGPGSFYPQTLIAKKNTLLVTTGHANSGWYEVLISGKTGWVNSEFLLGASPSSPIPATKNATVETTPAVTSKPSTSKEVKPVRAINVQALLAKYSSIREEWASYELDLIKVLDYPSITNLSIPSTGNFHKALSFTGYLAESINKDSSMHEAERFEEAVLDLNHKFNVMINEAKRLRWNSYTPQEQTSLRTAQKLLAMATNVSSTVHERQIAYKRLIKEIEGIIALPEKAMLELEARISLALNPASNS